MGRLDDGGAPGLEKTRRKKLVFSTGLLLAFVNCLLSNQLDDLTSQLS